MVIPRLHQVNQPSFLSLTSRFSNWRGQGTMVTMRPGWTAVEAAVGAPGCPSPPCLARAPPPGSRRCTCLQRALPEAAASKLLALCLSPGAQLHFLQSPPPPGPLPRACGRSLRFCFFAFPLCISDWVCFLTLLRQSKGRTWKANLKA